MTGGDEGLGMTGQGRGGYPSTGSKTSSVVIAIAARNDR
jgi:hypothetical protein